jgi:hypothetical protein
MPEQLGIVPTVGELLERPELGLRLSPGAAAGLLAKLEGTAAVLRVAAAAPERAEPGHWTATARNRDAATRWLTPDEAAAAASVSRRVVYGWSRRQDWRGFTHRLSRKVLRIEESGFRRWLERHERT